MLACHLKKVLAILLLFSIQLHAQNKSVSLRDALKKVTKTFGTQFVYDRQLIEGKTTTYNLDDISKKPTEEVLKGILYPNNLVFLYVRPNYYTIVAKEKLGEQQQKTNNVPAEGVIVSEAVVSSGKLKVTGTVLDSTNKGIPNVTVTEAGTKNSTLTSSDGTFLINVAGRQSTIIFSSVGFSTKQIPVGNQSQLTVLMEQANAKLDEVVVIGYGAVRRRDLTGAVSSLKSKDITAIPVSNALEVLQGKVAGMDITKVTGEAGAPVRVNLRGNRSLTASNDPLILVDGIPYGAVLDLNTSDIESMEVLKDASSTAIYGSRGANGVILITTKKGRTGKPIVSLSAYYGVQSPAGLPEIQNGDQYATFKREAFRTAGITDDNKIFNPGELAAINGKVYVDWMDEVLKNGSTLNTELSIVGGNEQTSYNVSFGRYNEEGLLRNDQFKRYNGSVGLTFKLTKSIKIGANALYTYKDNDKRYDPLNQANKILPFGTPYDSAGQIILYPVLGQTFAISPLADEVEGAYVDNRIGKRLFATSFLDWKITKDIVFRSTFGLDLQNDRRGYFRAKQTIQQNGGLSASGIDRNDATNYTWENTLNYNKIIGQHDLNFLLGNSIIKSSLESVSASGNDQVTDLNSFYNLASNSSSIAIASSLVESNLKSFFGRANYKFLGRYLLTASLRADGASVLAEGNKWAYFPSIAAGWRISDESFMENVKQISNLKLRASWGISGNSSVLPYQTLGSLGRSVYAFDETAAYGYYPKDISNPDLKWEKTVTANLGLDFGLFNNRITGSVEVYQSKTSDLLMQRILPTTSGFSSILENVGKTKNKGFELSLSTVNIAAANPRGFKWITDWTYFKNKEEIEELAGDVTRDLANSWFVGEPTQVYYDYQKLGIWQTKDDAEAAKYGQKPGDIQVKDINNDGKITAVDDRVIVGTERPKYTFGINNNFQYHNFDLTVFLYGRMGQTIRSEASGNYKISGLENGPVVDYWTPEHATNSHPRPDKDKTSNSAFMSTLYYVDGSFVKIRDITLGYSLPEASIERAWLARLRFYTTLKNFFTFSDMNPYDPERGGSISFPMTKQVVFGLNVSFK